MTAFTHFGVEDNGNDNGTLLLDEIRVGNSHAEVIGVPEPSAFAAVAGLFVLALAGLRRRGS